MKTIETNQANTQTIKLHTPLTQGDQIIQELVLTKPMVGHLRGVKLFEFLQADIDSMSTVLPRIVTNVSLSPVTLEQLDFVDLMNIQGGLSRFFPDSLAKG